MADGEIVARAGVRVQPDLDGFRRELASGLRKAVAGLKVQVPIGVDADALKARMETAVRSASKGVKAQIPIDFESNIAALRARLQAIVDSVVAGVKAEIPVSFNTRNMPKLGNGLGGGGGGSPGALLREIAKNATAAGMALGALANVVPVLTSVWAGISQLAGAAWLLPGALTSAAAAFATIKVATSGFKEALDGDAEALARLAPNARATVQAIDGLRDRFTKLRTVVQNNFFAGMADAIRGLANDYLPTLEQGMGRVATAINGLIRSTIDTLRRAEQVASVDEIFGHTAMAIERARASLGNFIAGFLTLGAIGSDYLPRLGDWITRISERFNNWVENNPERIRAMIDGAIQGFQQLWTIISNVGNIIEVVFTNLSAGGARSFLQVLAEMTTRALEFLQTVEATESLQAFGEALGVAGQAVRDVFLAALQAIVPMVGALAPLLAEIARQAAAVLVPAFQMLGAVFAAMAPWIHQNASAIATFVMILGGLGGVIGVAANLIRTFSTAVSTVGTVVRAVVTGIQLFTTVFRALNLVLIANPIGLVVTLIGLLVGAFITAYNTSETFRNVVQAAFNAVLNAGRAVVDGVRAAFQWFTTLPSLAAGWMSGLLSAVVSGGQRVIAWFGRVPSMILSALGNLGSLLINSGRALIDGFLRGLQAAWNRVVSWVRSAMSWLRSFWPFSPAKRGPFSGTGYLTYSGKAMMTDWGRAIQDGARKVGSIASNIMGELQGIFEEPLAANFAPDIERIARNMPSGMQAEVRGLVSSDDFAMTADYIAQGVAEGITGATLRVDGNGVARLVNKTNIRRVRRG